jgi:hypothetical protein
MNINVLFFRPFTNIKSWGKLYESIKFKILSKFGKVSVSMDKLFIVQIMMEIDVSNF